MLISGISGRLIFASTKGSACVPVWQALANCFGATGPTASRVTNGQTPRKDLKFRIYNEAGGQVSSGDLVGIGMQHGGSE